MSFVEWNKYLDEIAKTKGVEVDALKEKLVTSGAPGFTGATVSSQLIISNGLACERTYHSLDIYKLKHRIEILLNSAAKGMIEM